MKYSIINDLSWETVSPHLKLFITQDEFEEFKKNTYIVIEDINKDGEERDVIIGTNVGISNDIL